MWRRFNDWLYPELKLFDTLDARRQAEERTNAVTARSPRFWLGLLAMMVLGAFFTIYITSLARGHRFARVFETLSMLPFAVVGGFLVMPHRKIRRELRRPLRQRGVPICIPCGYNLTGVESPRCPECGGPFEANAGAKE